MSLPISKILLRDTWVSYVNLPGLIVCSDHYATQESTVPCMCSGMEPITIAQCCWFVCSDMRPPRTTYHCTLKQRIYYHIEALGSNRLNIIPEIYYTYLDVPLFHHYVDVPPHKLRETLGVPTVSRDDLPCNQTQLHTYTLIAELQNLLRQEQPLQVNTSETIVEIMQWHNAGSTV